MKRWQLAIGIVALAGIAAGIYFLKPVTGPARDLTLTADAGRGAYLIRLGGCVGCHTDIKNEGAELAGGPGLETAFGTFYPPNITPDAEAGIGGWTLADFSEAMSNGAGRGFYNHLYPSFPYDNYTLMSDQEIVDLYAALMARAADSTPSRPHEVTFPFNVRAVLAGWKNLFFEPGRYQPDSSKSEEWNRGRYLAYGPGHCVACHTPRNPLGGRDDNRAMQGSTGTPGGRVPAITKTSLIEDGYDRALLIDALKTGFTPDFNILGGSMGEVIAESTSHWTDADLNALATYLLDEES